MLKSLVGSVVLLCALASPSWAAPMTLNFTAADFSVSSGNPAPTDPVIGTIVYDAASLTSPINSLISITLTLDGHIYQLSEVDFTDSGAIQVIGGTLSTANGISELTNDFLISFFTATGTPYKNFRYASAQRSGLWQSRPYTQFSIIDGTQVPEPTSLALMLTGGLVGLLGTRRRRV